MTQFPKSYILPDSVVQARVERRRHIIQAVSFGVGIRTIIIIGELIGAALFTSAALFMDALSSFIDVTCSLLLILFIKLAEKPPDEDHPFGHGRYEPLAGLQLGLLLALIGCGMLIQQGFQLSTEQSDVILDKRAWIIPLCALVLLEVCYSVTTRAAKKHQSTALMADAAHYRIDSLTSLFATIALLVAAYVPHLSHMIDHLGAISISIFMIIMGAYTFRGNMHQLVDRIPESTYFERVKRAAKSVVGVFDTEKIRIQMYGPDAHVDIDIEVDPELSVEKAHLISQEVRVAIQKDWPLVRDATVHIEPYYPGDH